MNWRQHIIYFLPFFILVSLQGQDSIATQTFIINGEKVEAIVTEDDTLLLSNFSDSITISSPRKFKSRQDYLKYWKYRKYAAKVYPYAKDAIRVYRETEFVTKYMDKRTQKKYLSNLESTLKDQFENQIKKMTKTQGYILIEMIERELDMPMYEMIKQTRGTFVAGYYNQVANFFSIDLRDGYVQGEDEMLDIVIDDFNIAYDVERAVKKNSMEDVPMIPNY